MSARNIFEEFVRVFLKVGDARRHSECSSRTSEDGWRHFAWVFRKAGGCREALGVLVSNLRGWLEADRCFFQTPRSMLGGTIYGFSKGMGYARRVGTSTGQFDESLRMPGGRRGASLEPMGIGIGLPFPSRFQLQHPVQLESNVEDDRKEKLPFPETAAY